MKFGFKKYLWALLVLFIFLFCYYIRAINIVPDRLLSYDPIFQYRFTKYLADWGHLPVWDELTYYVGRQFNSLETQPFMYYVTVFAYWIAKLFSNVSIMTVCSYMSAILGALIVIPAFLLGRELSNKYGGIMAAALIGTAPQILVRTFGSSYDTDQIIVFFILLTLYAGFYALRKRTIASFCFLVISFAAFMMTWTDFSYTFIILSASIVVYFLLDIAIRRVKEKKFDFKASFRNVKTQILLLVALFICIYLIGLINNTDLIEIIVGLANFVQNAEAMIVNISIAELQPFSIFNINGWMLATGRFATGDNIVDISLFLIFIFFILFGLYRSFKKDRMTLSFLLTLFLIGIYTSFKGVRFTEYTSVIFITLISVGFGSLVERATKDQLFKAFSIGLGIIIILIALGIGYQLGPQLGPDINANWDNAWDFLRTKTPEFSIVGTWWDPGHMIAGLADRRDYADGAHCGDACFYGINDRIVDLGKIMVTSDENESINLIRKYQGDSSQVYWIASDDLIGKFQWLQYFGTGCDARTDRNCPLYMQIPHSSDSYDSNGNVALRNYALDNQTSIMVYNGQVPIPIFVQGINAVLFDEFIVYNGTQPIPIKPDENETNSILAALKPLEKQLNVRFTNQTVPMTVWIPQDYSYIVLIPPTLRESVFTKMFMLEGQGLEHFKQVFSNPQVKIYEVI
jgi:dolichyl-diphosphooligosaccharide--protein glycosyltransferase